MRDFQKLFDSLNSEQQLAVSTIEGPVLVIAGPGTGKTQLLSMRVAYIMKYTDTDPSNILCLTFTNKATTNMRDRIIGITGVEGRKVQVKTFHSFASEIMNQFPQYFWNGAKLSIAPEASQLDIVQNILEKLPLDNPLASKFSGKYTNIKPVQEGLKLAKEAGLTPDKLESIIKNNLGYIDIIEPILVKLLAPSISKARIPEIIRGIKQLPEDTPDGSVASLISLKAVITEELNTALTNDENTQKNTHLSKWKSRWIQNRLGRKSMFNERKRNAWWLELANIYRLYRQELHARNYFDYADMLVEVLSTLESSPDLLSEVQERYSYVLIDEFQDTNSAQLNLAHMVANHEVANGRPNIMAVGDDDQSIFAFNGAQLKNMFFFERKYKDTKKIVLEKNYRSSQQVLDTAKKIIEQAQDRLVTQDPSLNKNLISTKSFSAGEIKHLVYPTKEHQMSHIARKIATLKKQKPKESIAVVARGNESLRNLASLLLHLNVPVSYEIKSNILESEPVRQTILIIQSLISIKEGDNKQVSHILSNMLRHPMWQISPKELWELALKNQYEPNWLSTMLESETVNQKNIANALLWLSAESEHQPLGLTLEYVLGLRRSPSYEMPIRDFFSSKRAINNSYLQTLSALQMLREVVTEFSVHQKPTLKDFLDFVEINEQNDKALADESPFVSDKDSVELYSVHKAKGLEFDNVFIIDAIEDNWSPRHNKQKPPANLNLEPPLENEDDYTRLLYVAVTRARHTLYIASYLYNDKNQEKLASPLVTHAIDKSEKLTKKDLPESITVLEEALTWPHFDKAKESELLKSRLSNFTLNATNLINFLDLERGGPEYFFERNILRLPEAKTSIFSFGTAIHSAMEEALRLNNQDKFDLKAVIKAFNEKLESEHLPETDAIKLARKGSQLLEKIFKDYQYHLPKGSLWEQNLRNIRLKNAQISGKLDRIDFDRENNVLTIVDYKTGQPLSSFETKNKSLVMKAWRNKLQLIFYAILAKNDPRFKDYKKVEGQMVYLEAQEQKDMVRRYTPTPEDIAKYELLIDAVWNKVINATWPDVSSYSKDFEGTEQFIKDLINS